jgi:hypothetical protein
MSNNLQLPKDLLIFLRQDFWLDRAKSQIWLEEVCVTSHVTVSKEV